MHTHFGSLLASIARAASVAAACLIVGCREDTSTNVDSNTGQFGQPGTGYTAQCSGWFPDWISKAPPAQGETDFQMSQGYFLGDPIFQTVNGQQVVTGYNRPADATVTDAPWLAFDFHAAGQQMSYLDALLQYVLQDNAASGFVIKPPAFPDFPAWFNVPMMTTDQFNRREPLHGLTKERTLFHSDWSWITGSNSLRSYAIGYYNSLGSYTIGQVFKDVDPSKADASKANFVNGTLVFKILFSEYDPAKIDAASYPLTHAPEWTIQDVANPGSAHNIKVRLIQMDIAVKDPRSVTGWVFATYDYDDSNTDPNPWKRLTAVGMMWGDDPGVTSGPLSETWLNPALPAALKTHIGVGGRLVGPVDNPRSSCISCHSTAQADVGVPVSTSGSSSPFTGAANIPPTTCNATQAAAWFRDLPSGTAFGMTDANGAGCNLVATPPGTTLYSLDNSLQLQVGLVSSLYRGNTNPCIGLTPGQTEAPQAAAAQHARRMMKAAATRVTVDPKLGKAIETIDDVQLRR